MGFIKSTTPIIIARMLKIAENIVATNIDTFLLVAILLTNLSPRIFKGLMKGDSFFVCLHACIIPRYEPLEVTECKNYVCMHTMIGL